jgi:RNA polymerase sigma factor (sigma-70 family)
MATKQLGKVLRELEGFAGPGDGELLERFLGCRDEAAFGALVRRHGPMVLGVCRRVLRNEADAEDAFQATFLVLVRRGESVWPRNMVGNFLYGVALRTAQQARRAAARRRAKEACAAPPPGPKADPWDGLREALDRELSRLPDPYRAPLVLCDLEGKTRSEAARLLGWPEGTVASRLARSRKLLARRMARYGPTLAGGVWAAIVSSGMATAAVPPSLVLSTTRALAGPVPAPVAALTAGVLRSMLLTKVKFAASLGLVVTLAAGLALAGSRWPSDPTATAGPPAVAILHQTAAPADDADDDKKADRGAGERKTKEFDLSGFTRVAVGGAMHVEITRGDAFKTSVTAEENVLPHVTVAKEGDRLEVGLDDKGKSIHHREIKVVITMPALDALRLSGATHATCKGFKGGKAFSAELQGACHLQADVEAGTLKLKLQGASHATLAGSAKEATLTAHGASHAKMTDLALDKADVTLEGASHVKLNVKTRLDYTLSGASHLKYRGQPEVGRHDSSGVSSVGREKGSDKKDRE